MSTETTETTETKDTSTETVTLQKLTPDQEINALRGVHKFLSDFDRVPGSLASTWAQALDTIAVVANSLIAKKTPEASAEVETSDASTTAN